MDKFCHRSPDSSRVSNCRGRAARGRGRLGWRALEPRGRTTCVPEPQGSRARPRASCTSGTHHSTGGGTTSASSCTSSSPPGTSLILQCEDSTAFWNSTRPAESSRLEPFAAAGWRPATAGCRSGTAPAGASATGGGARRLPSRARERSGGRGDRRDGLGDSWRSKQPDGQDYDGSISAEFLAIAEAGRPEASGPYHRTAERRLRLGQRKRRWIRSQRMSGQGRLCESFPRSDTGSKHSAEECFAGAGLPSVQRGWQFAEKMLGEENASCGAPHSGVCGNSGGRGMVHCLRVAESGNDGRSRQDHDISGTSFHRRRQTSVSMAPDWPSRTTMADSPQLQKEAWPPTIQQVGGSKLDFREFSLSQGFGLHGNENVQPDQAKSPRTAREGLGEQAQTKTETKEGLRKRQEVRPKPRRRYRELTRTTGGAQDNHEVSSAYSKTLRSGSPLSADTLDSLSDNPDLIVPDLSPSSRKVFNGIHLMHCIVKSFWFCHSALKTFAAASVAAPNACKVEGNQSGSLWPIPPPGGDGWIASTLDRAAVVG